MDAPAKGNVVEKIIEGAYEELDRKPIPDNRGDNSTRLMEHIRDNPIRAFTRINCSVFDIFRMEPRTSRLNGET